MGISTYRKELEVDGYITVRVKNMVSTYGGIEYFAYKDGEIFEFGYMGLCNNRFLSKRNFESANEEYKMPIFSAFSKKGITIEAPEKFKVVSYKYNENSVVTSLNFNLNVTLEDIIAKIGSNAIITNIKELTP